MSELMRFCADVRIILCGPVVIAGLDSPCFGLDIPFIRNALSVPIIPDSHVKGVLRHACEYYGAHDANDLDIDLYFGSSEEEIGDTEAKGMLVFDDFLLSARPEKNADETKRSSPKKVTRVSIDETTQSSKEGHLLSVELIAEAGERLEFGGIVTLFAESEAEASEVFGILSKAAQFIDAVGKFKTVGFGQVLEIIFSDPIAVTETRNPPKVMTGTHGFRFSLSKPFLVDIQREDAHTLSGSQTISGSVIKGALARKLDFIGCKPREGRLAEILERLSFSNAHFEDNSTVPDDVEILALDTARRYIGNNEFIPSIWPKDAPEAFELEGQLPVFSHDFKGSYPMSKLALETRTRVAIDRENHAAEVGALFTQRLVCPHEVDGTPAHWVGKIEVPVELTDQADDAALVSLILSELGGGLHSIGKTNACTTSFEWMEAPEASTPDVKNSIKLTLSSYCLMLRTHHLVDTETYHEALSKYWSGVFEGAASLGLEQDLEGGDGPSFFCELEYRHSYAATRFTLYGDESREPFVLVKSGSVFTLDVVQESKFHRLLSHYLRFGLPAANWVGTTRGNVGAIEKMPPRAFEVCPFLPENGYGHFIATGGAT